MDGSNHTPAPASGLLPALRRLAAGPSRRGRIYSIPVHTKVLGAILRTVPRVGSDAGIVLQQDTPRLGIWWDAPPRRGMLTLRGVGRPYSPSLVALRWEVEVLGCTGHRLSEECRAAAMQVVGLPWRFVQSYARNDLLAALDEAAWVGYEDGLL